MKTFEQTFAEADDLCRQGHKVYQTWQCLYCGDEVVANTSNYWTEFGHHERCGHVTNLRVRGCGYIVIKAQKASRSQAAAPTS